MKKHLLKSSVCAGLLSLLLSVAPVTGSLKDVAKPYLGEYECKNAKLGDNDLLDGLSYLRLELKADNTFVLRYGSKEGGKREAFGEYEYDKEGKSITIKGKGEHLVKRSFPIEKGKILISFPIGNKQMILQFEQK